MPMLWAGIMAASVCRASAASGWVYADGGQTAADREAQERTWGDFCRDAREQSPINVDTKAAKVSASMPNIQTVFTAKLRYVKNTGHGFQLFETSNSTHELVADGASSVDGTGVPKGYSMIGGERYKFYQVHWHTPSENTIDGQSYPLEAHFVHQLDDHSLVGTLHRLAVIGLMYELGDCNTFLDVFWKDFPVDKGNEEYSGQQEIDLDDKLVQLLDKGYYHWYGSLTTPPCTEGVSWNLLRARETVCQAQVDKLVQALERTQAGIGFNNRVVQPLNHRVVTVTGPGFSNDVNAQAAEAVAQPAQQGSTDLLEVFTLAFTVLAFLTAVGAVFRA